MLASYPVRLACFSLASFFFINSVLAVATWLGARPAIRFGERLRPRLAARFLLTLRLLPSGLALFAVVGLCVPSYLWLEPKDTQEQVGLLCWTAALLCVLGLGISIVRVLGPLGAVLQYARDCRREGWEIPGRDRSRPLLVVDGDAPLLAVAGVVRPWIVVSSAILRELSSEQLDAALAHERTHVASRDNQKRLLMLLAPDVFPFCRRFETLERAWTRFTEWAADDQAAAGDSGRSLSLASALVRVARMGLPARPPGMALCFVADDTGLSARVDRLLRDKSAEDCQTPGTKAPLGAAILIGILAVAMLQPSTWYCVHRALEHLIR